MVAQQSYQSYQLAEVDGPPPLPLDLHEHKLKISIQWGILLLTSCIAPLVLYPSLHWGAGLSLKICEHLFIIIFAPAYSYLTKSALSVSSAILGASTLYALSIRTWRLVKLASNCRPLTSESRWSVRC